MVNNEIFLKKAYKGYKALIVEDDKACRAYVDTVLTRMGFTVITAVNGKKAIEIYEDGIFDLIFMDIQMPLMDGFTATDIIKKMNTRGTPIIAMSAFSQKYIIRKSREYGIIDYLIKPLTINDMVEIVCKWLPI